MYHQELITTILRGILAAIILVGPVIPYCCQFWEILKTQQTEGLSRYYCLMIISSNVLRIAFWIGERFDTALLVQSITNVISILALIDLCNRVKRKATQHAQNTKNLGSAPGENTPPQNIGENGSWHYQHLVRTFWRWSETRYYALSILVSGVALCSLTFAFSFKKAFISFVGMIALLMEGVSGIPQVYQNWNRNSTEGLSCAMVVILLIGDVLRMSYYWLQATPLQFYMCGSIQILTDSIAMAQIIWYSCTLQRLSPVYHKLVADEC